MRNLFQFIFKNIHWLLFCLLVYLSVMLIVKNNQFQRTKYLQVAREVTGHIYSVTDYFYSYFYLRSANADLLQRVAQLETELYTYQDRINALQDSVTATQTPEFDPPVYGFIPARVVYNSVSHPENYIMLDKGSNDGIQPDMGVISATGIVGVIVDTNPNFSTAISLLNTRYKPNGKIKHNGNFGPLVWDGKDVRYTYLTEIQRHAESEFQSGDTVVTSGNSTVFPPGIPIGTIVDWEKQRNDNNMSLRIRLFTNFNKLNNVLIVTNQSQKERKELEKRTLNLKTTR